MPTISNIYAIERSSCLLNVAFTDDSGTAMVPTSVKWTLTDMDGSIINDRSGVTSTLESNIEIVLFGDDLQILPTESAMGVVQRIVTIEAEYQYGAQTLPLNDSVIFYIKNLRAIE